MYVRTYVLGVDRHAEVIRAVGRENIEQLVGSLEFILESIAAHPEWRFKGKVLYSLSLSPPPLSVAAERWLGVLCRGMQS